MSDTPKRPWTPGEWETHVPGRQFADWPNHFEVQVKPAPLDPSVNPYPAPCRTVASVSWQGGFDVERANARLIAAAPDMFDALEDAADVLDRIGAVIGALDDDDRAVLDAARAALAKALGEEAGR